MTLIRRVSSNGVVFYASALFEQHGVRHAFSTRLGGVSPAPFDSLNLGNPNGCDIQDDTQHIAENYQLLMHAIGCENLPRYYLHQIHGAQVAVVEGSNFSNSTKGDILVGGVGGVVLSVRVADCCPTLVATTDGRRVAAIHAGWRGAVGGAINAAVEKMLQKWEVDPSELIAAVGPCIGFDAFEVGPEVLTEFQHVFGDEAPIRHQANGKGRVDLVKTCELQLMRSGVDPARIDLTNRCTFRDKVEFFSHRRDKGITGRMAALIASND